MKIDTIGFTVAYGFIQGPSTITPAENHFVDCDFSGSFSSNSVAITDSDNNALTTFVGSIFSNSVNITGGRYTMFSAMEFGANVTSSVNMSVVGSYGTTAVTFSGTGTRSCAGNSNITC